MAKNEKVDEEIKESDDSKKDSEEELKELDEEKGSETEEKDSGEEIKESGIFDEVLVGHDSGEPDLEIDSIDDDISDFSIGDTILSSAPSAHGRQGHNLEELAGREKAESSKWNDSGEFDGDENAGKDFYESLGKDFYGENQNRDSSHQGENNNQDLYNGGNGDLYSGESNRGGLYDAGKSDVKSYGEFADNKRLGRSMLEIAGFEDKAKQKSRDIRGFVKYEREAD